MANDAFYKNRLKIIFTIKMHWKLFISKNAFEMIFIMKMD